MSDEETESLQDQDQEEVEVEDEEDDDEDVDEVEEEPDTSVADEDELDDTSDYVGEHYNQFDDNTEYIKSFHPEELHISFDEMYNLSIVERDVDGNIRDMNHTTYPILSKYEKARIIGIRVNQLNQGVDPFIEIRNLNLDKHIIAEEELKQKKLPFIIKRPIPNGHFEYWSVKDLEMI